MDGIVVARAEQHGAQQLLAIELSVVGRDRVAVVTDAEPGPEGSRVDDPAAVLFRVAHELVVEAQPYAFALERVAHPSEILRFVRIVGGGLQGVRRQKSFVVEADMLVAFAHPDLAGHDAVGAVHGLLVAHHDGAALRDHGFPVDLVRLLCDLGVDDLGVEHLLDLGELRRREDGQDVGQVPLKQCPGIRRFQRNRALPIICHARPPSGQLRGDYDRVGVRIVSSEPVCGCVIFHRQIFHAPRSWPICSRLAAGAWPATSPRRAASIQAG